MLKINYWDYFKMESFCVLKETISKMNNQSTYGIREDLCKDISDDSRGE